MQLSVKYPELIDEIKKFTNREFGLEFVSNDTLHVSAPIAIPILGTRTIGLDLKFLGFEGSTLKIKAASETISKLLSLMPNYDYKKFIEFNGDTINVHLENINGISAALQYIKPTKLTFDRTTAYVEAITI